MSEKINEKWVREFIEDLREMGPEEIAALARMLAVRVRILREGHPLSESTARPAEDIIEDIIVAFGTAEPKLQRRIRKLIKITKKVGVKSYGTLAEDREEG